MTEMPGLLRVALPVPLAGAFDYRWPGPGPLPARGCRVRVSLGARKQIGIVVDHPTKTDIGSSKIKNIVDVLDEAPVLDNELLGLLQWCADYYHHPIGEVLNQALPVLLRRGKSPLGQQEQMWELTETGQVQNIEALRRRGKRQAEVLELLQRTGSASTRELRDADLKREVLKRLAAKGWIQSTQPVFTPPLATEPTHPMPELTREQQQCLTVISSARAGYQAFLLQGVTGSGKTEVYMRLISKQLEVGCQSLLLVPEIGLTPQLVNRLENRFGLGLAVMHSGLPAGERLRAWQNARTGIAKVIVGTRSAIFTPLVDAGLIIVDEEHDVSYKQQDGFKYSARDLAVLRAQRLNVPVILGSATPSLESIHNANQGRYQVLAMKNRIGSAGDPEIRIIDMNYHASHHDLSTPLISAIERHLSEDCQVILFLIVCSL